MPAREPPIEGDPVALFGQMDIYLLDQVLRGRIRPGMAMFDAGCGGGRNLAYFLRAGYDASGVDLDPEAVKRVRALAAELAPRLPRERFRVCALEELAREEELADVVVCNAVLHFARDEAQFDAMLRGAWSALRPGGLFFARLASSIGIEERVEPLGGRRFRLPDGSQRFLVDEARLLAATEALGGTLLDPIKTTNVQNQRCMTTWVVRA
jgi:SAM-dependent methyltransferase